jgi:large subunit ribosomal protein L10
MFLADFTGLNVAQMTDLRRKCRAEGVTFQVVKNTLAIRAARALELGQLEEHFRGPTAMAVSLDDPTSPARILVDFHKEHEKPQVKLGFVDGRVLAADEVKALAKLPTRDQLISQVMQLAQSPAQGFVGVLNALLSELVRTVDAVRDGMEKGTVPAGGAGEAAAAPEAVSAAANDVKAEEGAGGSDAPDEPRRESQEPGAAEEGSTEDSKTDQSEEAKNGE